MELLQNILAFIVAIGVLVTFHELGHYVIARASGVRIVRFSIGFGRPLASWRDARGTEFVLAAIPLGGYVRMLDERDFLDAVGAAETADDDRAAPDGSYQRLPVWWRIAIALGGPVANFILAGLLFALVFSFGVTYYVPLVLAPEPGTPAHAAGLPAGAQVVAVDGEPVQTWAQVNNVLAHRLGNTGEVVLSAVPQGGSLPADYRLTIDDWLASEDNPNFLADLGIRQANVVLDTVQPGSAAERAGLARGDIVVAVDGKPTSTWGDWVAAVQAAPGRTLTLTVLRDGQPRIIKATPERRSTEDGQEYGFLGVGPLVHTVAPGPLGALVMGAGETVDKSVLMVTVLGKMVVGDISTKTLSGPLMIGAIAGDSARTGLRYFIQVLGFLSVSLAVINLLPIPILDGGHVLFCLMELATGRPPSEHVQMVGLQIGMVLVAGMMMLAIYNDLARFLF